MSPRGLPRITSALVAILLVAPACVLPARSFDAYRGKALSSAQAMSSTVATAVLAVELASRSRAFQPFVAVALAQAEREGQAIHGTFDSIQPPDARSDSLRSRLDALLAPAAAMLTDLRIAARRGDVDGLTDRARPLRALDQRLGAFVSDLEAASG
jgi:hypothetical protein